MAMTLRDLVYLTDDFAPGCEDKVTLGLLKDAEADLTKALRQVVYREKALELAAVLEPALTEARQEVARLEESKGRLAERARAAKADYAAAVPTWDLGPMPDTGELHDAQESAREQADKITRLHRDAQKRVASMERLLRELRGIGRADRQVLTALADALADALNTAG